MKVGIMQPYFFPYLGYWQLINAVDKFLLLENVQFISHGWIERNRIINYSGDWSYIKVPLEKHSQDTLIRNIRIKNGERWREKILSQLVHYKRKACYYYNTIELVKSALSIDTQSITELNAHVLTTICGFLDIRTKIEVFDINKTEITAPTEPDEWALNICIAMEEVDKYINPEGGKSFFCLEKYKGHGIEVEFIKSNLPHYNQKKDEFVGGLSIIDILMFNSKDEIKRMLHDYNTK